MKKRLLVSIGIVVVLIAVAVPYAIQRLIQQRLRRDCIDNMRWLAVGGDSYCMDKGHSFDVYLSQNDLVKDNCLRGGLPLKCPSCGLEYQPFNPYEGPVCPGSHGRLFSRTNIFYKPWDGTVSQYKELLKQPAVHHKWAHHPAVPRITLELLSDPDVRTQYFAFLQTDQDHCFIKSDAIDLLGHLRAQSAVQPLMEVLTSDRWMMRLKAAEALGKIGDAQAIQALTKLTQDDNARVRQAASNAIAAIRQGKAP